jgi:hypothetical protein
MSYLTGANTELIYINPTSGTAKGTFTTEIAINDVAGMGVRAHVPPDFWRNANDGTLRTVWVIARGIFSTTLTPTYTFTLRLGTLDSITSVIALGSAALTTTSGAANAIWEFNGHFALRTFGTTAATATGHGEGLFSSFGTANKIDPIWGGGASPGTFSTLDTTITNYFNFNVTCSASSGSNTVTLHQLLIAGMN